VGGLVTAGTDVAGEATTRVVGDVEPPDVEAPPEDKPLGALDALSDDEPLDDAAGGDAVAPDPDGGVAAAFVDPACTKGSDGSTVPADEDADAVRATFGVASSETLAALSCPTGFEAPTLRSPTLAATAPLAAVTKMAVAPAKVSARCLFMAPTVGTALPTQPSRMVKNWQSHAANRPKTNNSAHGARVGPTHACHP
jgi:hypothetical protein